MPQSRSSNASEPWIKYPYCPCVKPNMSANHLMDKSKSPPGTGGRRCVIHTSDSEQLRNTPDVMPNVSIILFRGCPSAIATPMELFILLTRPLQTKCFALNTGGQQKKLRSQTGYHHTISLGKNKTKTNPSHWTNNSSTPCLAPNQLNPRTKCGPLTEPPPYGLLA